MPKGYWIGHVQVTDPQGYPAYLAANTAPLAKYGARFIVRGGRYNSVEGVKGDRHVVIEFPTYEAALACYQSPEYQQALAIRKANSVGEIVIVEGVA